MSDTPRTDVMEFRLDGERVFVPLADARQLELDIKLLNDRLIERRETHEAVCRGLREEILKLKKEAADEHKVAQGFLDAVVRVSDERDRLKVILNDSGYGLAREAGKRDAQLVWQGALRTADERNANLLLEHHQLVQDHARTKCALAIEQTKVSDLTEALTRIANYDNEPIWGDDRDEAADAMLHIARLALGDEEE